MLLGYERLCLNTSTGEYTDHFSINNFGNQENILHFFKNRVLNCVSTVLCLNHAVSERELRGITTRSMSLQDGS